MSTIAITRSLLESGITELLEDHDVRMPESDTASFTEDEMIEFASGADALISTVGDPVTARVFKAAPALQVVAQYAVGYDNIDLDAAREHGVVVTHTPDVLTDATADLTMAIMLAVARRIKEADAFVRSGKFKEWGAKLMLGMGLRDKQIGIVGLGRIGEAVARRAKGFGMKVTYHNRNAANPTIVRMLGATRLGLEELLKSSDVISLHCPLNSESHHLLDADAFKKMKATSVLVNTSRGQVIDEAALVEALEKGEIAGAALDVYENEPDVHPGLLEHDRVVLTPHIGSATVEARTNMGRMCVEAIHAVFQQEEKIPYRIA